MVNLGSLSRENPGSSFSWDIVAEIIEEKNLMPWAEIELAYPVCQGISNHVAKELLSSLTTSDHIDPVGKLLFREEKSILVTGTAPFLPFCSFGQGYNSVIIAMI